MKLRRQRAAVAEERGRFARGLPCHLPAHPAPQAATPQKPPPKKQSKTQLSTQASQKMNLRRTLKLLTPAPEGGSRALGQGWQRHGQGHRQNGALDCGAWGKAWGWMRPAGAPRVRCAPQAGGFATYGRGRGPASPLELAHGRSMTWGHPSVIMVHRITESQNSRGWKGPLWVTQSNPPAEAGSPTAGCTGPCPGGS